MREKIKSMVQLDDIRESRAYQEAKEEGREQGRKEGIEEGVAFTIAKMAAKGMSAEDIAAMLELDLEQIRQAIAHAKRN
jgi:predicted transposase/invertase (TIGR01784 family)